MIIHCQHLESQGESRFVLIGARPTVNATVEPIRYDLIGTKWRNLLTFDILIAPSAAKSRECVGVKGIIHRRSRILHCLMDRQEERGSLLNTPVINIRASG